MSFFMIFFAIECKKALPVADYNRILWKTLAFATCVDQYIHIPGLCIFLKYLIFLKKTPEN